MNSARLLLLGDSIIDNRAYIGPGEPDVAEQVRTAMPGSDVEMRAVDGSVTADVARNQIADLRDDDIIVLSTGGNDALSRWSELQSSVQDEPVGLLAELWKARESFRKEYQPLLARLNHGKRRILVMTIYNPNFLSTGEEVDYQRAAECGLSIFNDVIQQEAAGAGCGILELRSFFEAPYDYANPIEPSAAGGGKLAVRIRDWAASQN